MSFPLFDTIKKEVDMDPEFKLSDTELRILAQKINKFDQESHEKIYVLIKMYQMKEGIVTYDLPYGGRNRDGDINFTLEDFPNILVHMLKIFVDKHEISILEELGRG